MMTDAINMPARGTTTLVTHHISATASGPCMVIPLRAKRPGSAAPKGVGFR